MLAPGPGRGQMENALPGGQCLSLNFGYGWLSATRNRTFDSRLGLGDSN
jgi:hypothetical protein